MSTNKTTILKYENLEDITIKADENITDARLNESFTKLLENDKSLSPSNNNIPSLWECSWLNDDTINGYRKGQSVWYNTEDVDEFIRKKKDELYQYGISNKYLVKKIQPYDESNKEINEFYHDLLSGFYRENYGMSKPLPPIFDIGNLSGSVQVFISQKDNNKVPPSKDTEQKYWKPFLKQNNLNLIQEILNKFGDSLYTEHIKNYHMGFYNKNTKLSNTFLVDYLGKNPSEITEKQKFQDHVLRRDLKGFDYVKKEVQITNIETTPVYEEKRYETYRYELSNKIYVLKNWQNYSRGYYTLRDALSDTINYATDVQPFLYKVGPGVSSNIAFADISFTLCSNFIDGDAYPKQVWWKDRGSISSIMNRYSVSYKICDYKVSSFNEINVSSYYVLSGKEYILSSFAEGITPPQITNYKLNPIPISSRVEYELSGYISSHVPTKWFRLWNSGYLEHGGEISVLSTDRGTLKTVNLRWNYNGTNKATVYDYPSEGNESFYGLFKTYSDTTPEKEYDKTGNLQDKYRYTVTLTPVVERYTNYNGQYNTYLNSEITEITNSQFKIKIPSTSTVSKYRYYVSGFRNGGQ